ncbi:hypothetical protein E4U16_006389 [Claviceps sp. LM84 group G4]|nr:hypothetical protein E4U33_003257 [Claviceps sp. LM78 group G4]KAG6082234.1 hypothetical protein E4U16_006389 [Claviceps sp. LM84 group G4]
MFPFFSFSFLYLGKAVLYECAGRHKRTVCFVFLHIYLPKDRESNGTGFSLLRLRDEGSFDMRGFVK